MMTMLVTCQAGFETLLAEEATQAGLRSEAQGPGWVLFAPPQGPLPELAFAYHFFGDTQTFTGESVNALAQAIATYFLESLRGERIEAAWPCYFNGPAELVGLGRRIGGVEKAFLELLKKKLNRIAKLASPDLPRGGGECRGLFVWFSDFGKVHVSRRCLLNGQRRMADDDLAPSRSYLKVEEAYVVLGREPAPGETVVDLGAAPGGWSYSAAKRGAKVIAVDNGPLKGGALDNPQIQHLCEDAFRFQVPEGGVDWLFCDMVEEPHHVLHDLIEPWLARRWCRRFVINFKFGRVDPVGLLQELRSLNSPFVTHCEELRIRHLYHDREEFTVVGKLKE